jgi:hypothetical protein
VNVYPEDLGSWRHLQIMHRRTYAEAVGSQSDVPRLESPPSPRLGPLGRFWARGSGLTPEQAARVLPGCAMATMTHQYLWPLLWVFLGGLFPVVAVAGGKLGQADPTWALPYLTGSTGIAAYLSARLCRSVVRKANRTPLKPGEVEALPGVYDDLERAYLGLVLQAIRQTVPAQAEAEVRKTLRALGEAIAELPGVAPADDDSGEILREAERLRGEAAAEPDAVVAESLERQAESLARRAESVRRSALLVRRMAMIRQEMAVQMETLRAGLAAFTTGAGNVADLVHLADSVRRVATEADAIAAAREELDAAPPVRATAMGGQGAALQVRNGR